MKKLFAFIFSLCMAVQATGLAATPKSASTPAPVASPAPAKPTHVKVTADPDRTLWIKGDIDSKSADSFITDLNNLDSLDQKKPIYIIISSPGGSVEDGFRIENNMDALRAPTICIVEDHAESMASGIFLHCGARYMRPHATLFFHYGSINISAPRLEAVKSMEHAIKVFDQMDQDNADHLGLTLKEYRAKIDHDWWLTETEAIKAHAADAIVDDFRAPQPAPSKTLDDEFFKLFP